MRRILFTVAAGLFIASSNALKLRTEQGEIESYAETRDRDESMRPSEPRLPGGKQIQAHQAEGKQFQLKTGKQVQAEGKQIQAGKQSYSNSDRSD